MREIDAALTRLKVHGGRMNEEQMKVVTHDIIQRLTTFA
jgi:hypothetical protein